MPDSRTADHGTSTITLVECVIRASPTLARLLRNGAKHEAAGASAREALLLAAGIKPGELPSLRDKIGKLSAELEQVGDQLAREHAECDRYKSAFTRATQDLASLRREARGADHSLSDARQHIRDLELEVSALVREVEHRDERLGCSLSLAGLGGDAAAMVTAVRDRLVQDQAKSDGGTLASQFGAGGLTRLTGLIDGGGFRLAILRWLLRQ